MIGERREHKRFWEVDLRKIPRRRWAWLLLSFYAGSVLGQWLYIASHSEVSRAEYLRLLNPFLSVVISLAPLIHPLGLLVLGAEMALVYGLFISRLPNKTIGLVIPIHATIVYLAYLMLTGG